MAKSLLILMLMTTQLLTGSGGLVYLCISNDGSYRFHAGSEPCIACQVHCGPGCNVHRDADEARPCNSRCTRHRESRLSEPSVKTVVVTKSCDCIHIPVATKSKQPTTTNRISISVDFERFSSLVALSPTIRIEGQSAFQPTLHGAYRSSVSDFSLTVVSTVIIRC